MLLGMSVNLKTKQYSQYKEDNIKIVSCITTNIITPLCIRNRDALQ